MNWSYSAVGLRQLVVHQAGVNLQRIVPVLQNMSIHLDQYFSIVHPEVTFTILSIRKFINSHFVLQTRRDMLPEAWNNRPMLQLRGKGLKKTDSTYFLLSTNQTNTLFMFSSHRSDDLDALSQLYVLSSLSSAEKSSGTGGARHAHF